MFHSGFGQEKPDINKMNEATNQLKVVSRTFWDASYGIVIFGVPKRLKSFQVNFDLYGNAMIGRHTYERIK